LPDFTNAEASRWWTEKRRYLLEELGIDGFKTDGGEHAWGTDLRYADGSDGGETNNRYPVLYGEAYSELLRSAGHNPVVFSRAGYTGSGSLPCHWAGDEDSTWEAFRASISAGLSAGACGIFFWGWDIAGFSGPVPAPELYLRATAMAALCPIMQYHSEYNHHRRPSRDRTPWNVAEETGDPGVIAGFRRFVELRERLVPYLAEQGALCVSDGKPLMRALCFEVAGDDRIWDFPEEYFLGDHLVVAPVTQEGAKTWQLYVPAGEWIDPWTGDAISGPAVVERAAPLDQIPLLVAAARPDLVAAIQATTELRKDA
jgi:alpha-glucosidase (family GH31 glycosyl hydrolase)